MKEKLWEDLKELWLNEKLLSTRDKILEIWEYYEYKYWDKFWNIFTYF